MTISPFPRLSCLVLALFLVFPAGAFAQDRPLTGSLRSLQGIDVLTLTGSPAENGYARGYLMAQKLHDTISAVSLFVPQGVDFSGLAPMIVPRLVRPENDLKEMQGIIDGMRARLGPDGLHIAGFSRPLVADDLWMLLALPDVHCSAFAAWGDLTPDGSLIVGRNLDYAGKKFASGNGCIIITKPTDPKAEPWINFTIGAWPGVSTAIRADGVFAAILDAAATGPAQQSGNLRYFVLRDFVESSLQAHDLSGQAAAFFRGKPILRGTNFFLCSPTSPACVVEYDGNLKKDNGVTIRDPATDKNWIAVTNHFRERCTAVACNRYAALQTSLDHLSSAHQKIATLQDGWNVIQGASQGSTLMTLVYHPAQRKVLLSFTDGHHPADKIPPVEISLDDLLAAKN